MYLNAQPIATLRTPNERGQSRIHRKRSTINQSKDATSFLQIDPVSLHNGRNRMNTYVFLDRGSTVFLSIKAFKNSCKLDSQMLSII